MESKGVNGVVRVVDEVVRGADGEYGGKWGD